MYLYVSAFQMWTEAVAIHKDVSAVVRVSGSCE